MEEKPKNPFVHPVRHTVIKDNIIQTASDLVQGMTLLDYFAAAALQGIYASHDKRAEDGSESWVREAYDIADSMLRERERRGL